MNTPTFNNCQGTACGDPLGAYSNWADNAMEKRREWMTMLGLDEAEIAEYCPVDGVADLDEECEDFNAMVELQQLWAQQDGEA